MPNRFVTKLAGMADLSGEDVAALAALTGKPRRLGPKHDLIREGDTPGPVFVMLDGWACRYKILPSGARQIMAFLMPGHACDLHANLFAEMDHGMQTLCASEVATISRGDMRAIMDARPAVARAMYAAQGVDEGTLRAWIVSMGRRSSIERVAHLMCELHLRAATIGLTDGGTLVLPCSQIVLADALGMTPVHVNRVLKELRLAGAMELRRGSLVILDAVKLARIAGFDENYLHRRARRAA